MALGAVKKYAADSVIKRHRLLKVKAVEYKGGKCEICGYNKCGKCEICGYDKCIDALEFHHLDPQKKKSLA